ncbi:calcium-binding protein [Caulobacter sp. RHG1]|uniref:calcium-binding protein n=1 Tax=Caulobacter sp. (strain RHG1) TaxID=2545762 RepID=UPI0015520F86|nr:calcium-binding protein [Caulobacter sp. RHG1]NQE60455.1 hypothetical protein [Caulobacter sp. RHG1]
MGEILAFSPRPPATDWSANERGLLMLLTQQLASSYGEIDSVFGQTDSGDPWYVVTDSNQDVLVHIARIDGRFVVHDAAIDMFSQVGSLWGALRQVLSSGGPEETGGNVVAFNPASREAQSFLSLVIAVGLYLELRGIEVGEGGRLNFDNLPRANDLSVDSVTSRLIASLGLDGERAAGRIIQHSAAEAGVAAPQAPIKPEALKVLAIEAPVEAAAGLSAFKVAHLAAAAPLEVASSAPQTVASLPEDAPVTAGVDGAGFAAGRSVMTGTANADVMFGTAEGEVIKGEGGDDYIDGGGAKAGQIDRIDGGAGDDKIVMNARVVASGGTGADTFLIVAHEPTTKLEALLGVVLDYSAAKGDHLAVMGKGHVTVVSTAAVSNVLAAQEAVLGEAIASQVTDVKGPVAGTRVGFDLDGDGREDVFILLGGATTSTFKIGATIANDHDLPKVPLIGQPAHDGGGLFDDGAQR